MTRFRIWPCCCNSPWWINYYSFIFCHFITYFLFPVMSIIFLFISKTISSDLLVLLELVLEYLPLIAHVHHKICLLEIVFELSSILPCRNHTIKLIYTLFLVINNIHLNTEMCNCMNSRNTKNKTLRQRQWTMDRILHRIVEQAKSQLHT